MSGPDGYWAVSLFVLVSVFAHVIITHLCFQRYCNAQ
jgi:hypothetical protein